MSDTEIALLQEELIESLEETIFSLIDELDEVKLRLKVQEEMFYKTLSMLLKRI